jgi:Tol biopolymer transport system component
MRDDAGVVQIWTVSPNGGPPTQVTRNPWDIASAFSWSPDGRQIAHVIGNSVCVTDVISGQTVRLTVALPIETSPRPEACVFSPDGRSIAFVRPAPADGRLVNQVFIVDTPAADAKDSPIV